MHLNAMNGYWSKLTAYIL